METNNTMCMCGDGRMSKKRLKLQYVEFGLNNRNDDMNTIVLRQEIELL